MRVFIISIIALCSLLITGCTKDFNLKADKNRPQYVIEGRVSDLKGPYYVRITYVSDLDKTGVVPGYDGANKARPVRNAQVIIRDEAGDIDTLIPVLQQSLPVYDYRYNYATKRIDSTSTTDLDFYRRDTGYYCTTHLRGIAGHTYHLKVVIDKQEFEASAYMPPAPAMDSANLKPSGRAADGRTLYLPYAWFKEPQGEQNYYLFQYYNAIDDYPYDYAHVNPDHTQVFPYYVMDDNALPAYVNGLAIDYTFSSQGSNVNGYTPMYDAVAIPSQVRLFALTKETYLYFTQLIKQFQNDGNVYKPAPATPVSNISSGATGFFYATGASYALIMPK